MKNEIIITGIYNDIRDRVNITDRYRITASVNGISMKSLSANLKSEIKNKFNLSTKEFKTLQKPNFLGYMNID